MSVPDPGLVASIVGRLKLNYSTLLYTLYTEYWAEQSACWPSSADSVCLDSLVIIFVQCYNTVLTVISVIYLWQTQNKDLSVVSVPVYLFSRCLYCWLLQIADVTGGKVSVQESVKVREVTAAHQQGLFLQENQVKDNTTYHFTPNIVSYLTWAVAGLSLRRTVSWRTPRRFSSRLRRPRDFWPTSGWFSVGWTELI